MTDYDTIIIGAGPSGTSAAILLARAGRRVAMFDRSTFPRPKVCGGCVSGIGTALLKRLLPGNRALPGIESSQLTFVMGNYRLRAFPNGGARLVPRAELDYCLVDAAAREGVAVFTDQAVELVPNPKPWSVSTASVGPLCAKHILLGTGSGTLPGRLAIEGRSFRRKLVGQQWSNPPDAGLPAVGEVELHWLRGGYVGVATSSPHACIIALAADVSLRDQGSPWQRLWELNPNAPILQLLGQEAACRNQARGCAGFPWLPRCVGRDNVLLIGDLVGYAEPYSGEGIGLAMLSGRCAAKAILSDRPALREYTRLISRYHRPTFWMTHLSARLLDSAVMHRLANLQRVVPQSLLSHIVSRFHLKGMRWAE